MTLYYNIVAGIKGNDGSYRVQRQDSSNHLKYRDIRAGLAWPVDLDPGHFCIVGQQTVQNQRGEYPLQLIGEGTGETIHELLRLMGDDTRALRCQLVYSSLEKGAGTYQDIFFQDSTCRNLRIHHAPFANDFAVGLHMIRNLVTNRALDLPKDSTIRAQLGKISKDAMASSPEKIFTAINALRFVVGSFDRHPPAKPDPEIDRLLNPTDYSHYPGYGGTIEEMTIANRR